MRVARIREEEDRFGAGGGIRFDRWRKKVSFSMVWSNIRPERCRGSRTQWILFPRGRKLKRYERSFPPAFHPGDGPPSASREVMGFGER